MSCLGIIPARYASSRFPGKPLVDIEGKSMIRRVYEQCLKSELLHKVIVATDDNRILDHVKKFGGDVMMTSPNHQSGTERCAEVALSYPQFSHIINIQGDEPFINPAQIDLLADFLTSSTAFELATLCKKIEDKNILFNSNVVKVVMDKRDRALYFSRSTIPFFRDLPKENWLSDHTFFKHIGIYGYQATTLQSIVKLPEGKLEKAEKLEQLRWLENGYAIGVRQSPWDSMGIDTPEDLKRIA